MAKYYIAEERLNISRGLVDRCSIVHKFGYNPDIDTNTDPETVWTYGGFFPWSAFDSGATALSVVSTSASDVLSVTVVGLDANMLEINDTVTLSGITPVSTTKQFKRVFRAYCSDTVGNVGDITISANGSVVGHIVAGEAQTLMALYTVPADKTGYLYCGDCSVNDKNVTVKFYVRYPGGPFRIAHVVELNARSYRYDFPFPMQLPSGSDLEVRVDNASDNNCRVSANFDLLLIEN